MLANHDGIRTMSRCCYGCFTNIIALKPQGSLAKWVWLSLPPSWDSGSSERWNPQDTGPRASSGSALGIMSSWLDDKGPRSGHPWVLLFLILTPGSRSPWNVTPTFWMRKRRLWEVRQLFQNHPEKAKQDIEKLVVSTIIRIPLLLDHFTMLSPLLLLPFVSVIIFWHYQTRVIL